MGLTPEQLRRYARHVSLPNFGVEAQKKLLQSSVLMVGIGGLGCPAAMYLAAAGVGRLILIDDDHVELSNLQRQILHGHKNIGRAKVLSTQEQLADINPDTKVLAINERLTAKNARQWIADVDVVLDGADNFPTRYILNDAAFFERKPLVHGSIFHNEGQLSVFHSPHSPCYRCLFPVPPKPGSVPSCAEAGVLGVLPGIVGIMQATETIKILTGIGDPLLGQILTYDALAMETHKFKIHHNPSCPLCGSQPSILNVKDITWTCSTQDSDVLGIDFASMKKLGIAGRDFCCLDVRQPEEVALGAFEGGLNIPLRELRERISELEQWKENTIVCCCQSGGRSLKGIALLKEHGFDHVLNLKGGYQSKPD